MYQRKQKISWAALRGMLPAGQGNDLWSIVWSSEDLSAREKRSYQKEFRQEPLSFPLKSLCISHGKKDRENWDGSTWRRGQRRDIIHVYKCLKAKCTKKNKKYLLQCFLVTWPETVCPNLNMWSFFWASWKNFLLWEWALEQVVQRDCEVSILVELQKSPSHGPEQSV